MPDPPRPSQVAIPESLRQQLADFRRHLWKVKILEAIAAGVIGLLISFLLVYGLDRILPTPGWARLVILLGGVSLFGVFAPYWLHRWVWGQRRDAQLARLIAQRYPGLGDRLLGVIELQHQEGSADSLSPRLREAAMQAVAAETGHRKLDDALPAQKHRRWTLAAMLLALISAAAFTLTPRAGINAFQRWLLPFSKTERYTFTKLDNPPTQLAVAYGEAFDVTLQLSNESEKRPTTASGQYGLQPEIPAALKNNIYRFTFPGQQDPGTIDFHIGDMRHSLKVTPMPRPTAESVRAQVAPPTYLGIPVRSVDLNAGVLSAVEGSKIAFGLEMSRPLTSGKYGPTRALATIDGKEPAAHTPLEGNLTIRASSAETPTIDLTATPFEIPFSWVDQSGLTGESGFRLRVDVLKDMAPTCYLQGIDRQKVMLPEETIDFEVLAEDDFGLKATGIEWKGEFTKPTPEAPAKGELQLAAGAPEERRMIKPAAFSPAALGITPQKITLRGYAEDYLPNRERVFSEPIIIYVMTRDEHAQMLKTQFDRQITEFEDLARREAELLDENEELNRKDGKELQQEENRKRLEDQEQKEAETERRMDELTKKGEQLMKDAARNGEIDKKTMQKMAEALKSMQELSQQDIPKVQEKLADSQEQSNTPEKTKQDVEQSIEEQKKVVEKMKDAIEKANDANRRFEAGTFVNRLKKAANEQNSILGSLKEAFNRMLGLKSAALSASDVRRIAENTRQQIDTASDVRWLQEDLGHYFTRTQKEPFKVVYDEMRESKIDIGLNDIQSNLAENHAYKAAEKSKLWADKLTAWAKKLEGDNQDENSGGGGGGGGSPPPEDEDFEFMLRVMKIIQQEQDLRSRTRVIEQLRRNSEKEKPAPNVPQATLETP